MSQASVDPPPASPAKRSLRIAAAFAACALAFYAPGFFIALPVGFATSTPFWAMAKDYTCSSTHTESLMVRVSPYVTPSGAQRPGAGDCRRIALLSRSDLGAGAPSQADEDGSYYMRIYTPSPPPPARAEGAESDPSEILRLPARPAPQRDAKVAPPQRSSQQASP